LANTFLASDDSRFVGGVELFGQPAPRPQQRPNSSTAPQRTALPEIGRLQNAACLILDLRMPGMSGLGLLQSLSAAGSGVPIVILTGHTDGDARVRCLQAGAIAFLHKPLDTGAVLHTVMTIMSGSS
jgi:FixJ family two-component response regulator